MSCGLDAVPGMQARVRRDQVQGKYGGKSNSMSREKLFNYFY